MAIDPKKDDFKGSEIADDQLENVAGGDKIRDGRVGRNLSATELSDADLKGVAGGKAKAPSLKNNKAAEEAPD